MQGSLSLLACACLVLVLPAGALPLAGTSGAASLARAEAGSAGRATFKQTVTIELTSLTMIESQHLEPPRDRPRKGDYIAFRDLLLNRHAAQFGKKAGKAVAWDEGIVIYTSATGDEDPRPRHLPGARDDQLRGAALPRCPRRLGRPDHRR